MNAFYQVAIAAKENRLPDVSAEAQAYYASDAFAERSRLIGPTSEDDAVRVLLFMLQHVAVDPRDDERTRLLLEGGIACIAFWGVCNPIPMVTVHQGSTNHRALLDAYNANLKGPFARALTRLRRRRARLWEQSVFREAMYRRYYDAQPWPTPADFKADPEQARQQQGLLGLECQAYQKGLADRYATRLSKLNRATCPRYISWHDLILGIALNVLTPPTA